MKKINVGIIGSRNFDNYELMKSYINQFIKTEFIDSIISGGAKGADQYAELYADENMIELKTFIPDWKKYGRGAGIVRNKDIISYSDMIFAFWDGKSKGTKSSIDIARKQNKQVYICNF